MRTIGCYAVFLLAICVLKSVNGYSTLPCPTYSNSTSSWNFTSLTNLAATDSSGQNYKVGVCTAPSGTGCADGNTLACLLDNYGASYPIAYRVNIISITPYGQTLLVIDAGGYSGRLTTLNLFCDPSATSAFISDASEIASDVFVVNITVGCSVCNCTSPCGNKCGASDNCCDDYVLGPTCYDPTRATCVNYNRLCGYGDLTCGSQCYSPSLYDCITPQNFLCPKGYLLCGQSCYDPTKYQCEDGELEPL